jgi:hypothetical protein
MHDSSLDYVVKAWLEKQGDQKFRAEHIQFCSADWDLKGRTIDLGKGTAFLYYFSTREIGGITFEFENIYEIQSGKQVMFYDKRNIHFDYGSDLNKVISGHSSYITLHTDRIKVVPTILNPNAVTFFHALVMFPIEKHS